MITSHLEVGFKIASSAVVYISPYKAIGCEAGLKAGCLLTWGNRRGQETLWHPFLPKEIILSKALNPNYTWVLFVCCDTMDYTGY